MPSNDRRLSPLALIATAALAAATSVGCFMGAALNSRTTVVETRALEASGTLRIRNQNGGIAVTTWSEPRVKIEAEKAAASQADLDAVKIDISGEGARVEVETRAPGGRPFGRPYLVSYRISVPVGARLDLETVNGSVDVRGVAGAVRGRTTNGSVDVDQAAGEVEATTTNGTVRVELATVVADGRYGLKAVNGTVRLSVPRGTSGYFEARTVNGSISTGDLPLKTEGKWGPKSARGQVGDGKARFILETVNGTASID